MKVIIPHRWNSDPCAVEEISNNSANPLRDAVEQSVARHANLTDASLAGADLTDANLARANLTDARDDFRAVLTAAPNEVVGLLAAIREGRVDGSCYEGACSCLKGTIGTLRGVRYDRLGDAPALRPNSSSPAERLFMAISPGHVPAINPVAKIVEGWILEWQAEQASSQEVK